MISECITHAIFPKFKPYVNYDKSSFQLKFTMRVDLILVTEKGKSFHEVLLVITQKKTIYAAHSKLLVNFFFTCVAKYLKDNKHNSLYFVQKYVWIFVLRHNLFLEAQSFYQASLSLFSSWIR